MSGSGDQRDDIAFARSIALFEGLDDDTIGALLRRSEVVHVSAGDAIMSQSDPADCCYVLRVGRLRVTVRRPDGSEVCVGHIGHGDVVGEMSLISDEPRSATVSAERDSELLRISTEVFDELIASDPTMLRRISSAVVARVRDGHRGAPPATPSSMITVSPLGRDPVAVDTAGALIAALVGSMPSATTVTYERTISAVGDWTPGTATEWERAAARWVSDLERSGRRVVFDCCDVDAAHWSTWCARQSDLVLAVADVVSPARETAAADAAQLRRDGRARVELVLARPAWMQDARDTRSWLEAIEVDRHHHVRAGERADVERVTRLALGRPVVLVLSGGGARGIAQIGAVRAVQELGLPIDAVGGTSIGSLVGGAVARGWGWERIEHSLREGLTGGRGLVDPTVPVLSLAGGRRVTDRLRTAAGELDIEDFLLDYFCVSTNLTRKRAHVHVRGSAWRAIRASLAIPGLLPPVPFAGDVLVDGGLVENFPVARMRDRHRGAAVFGIDVGSRKELIASGVPESCELPPWSALRVLTSPSKRRASLTISRVLVRLTELGLVEPTGADLPDVTVAPGVQDLPILDFDRFDEFTIRGYDEAMRVLEPWAESAPV